MSTCLLNSHSVLFPVLQYVLVWTVKLLVDNLKNDVLCNNNEGRSAGLRVKVSLESDSVDSNLVPLLMGYVI